MPQQQAAETEGAEAASSPASPRPPAPAAKDASNVPPSVLPERRRGRSPFARCSTPHASTPVQSATPRAHCSEGQVKRLVGSVQVRGSAVKA